MNAVSEENGGEVSLEKGKAEGPRLKRAGVPKAFRLGTGLFLVKRSEKLRKLLPTLTLDEPI